MGYSPPGRRVGHDRVTHTFKLSKSAQVAQAEGSVPMSLAIGEGVLSSVCVPPSGALNI